MKAIKQILFDFRHQSVISWVTLSGTMLSVFLIMVVVMMQQVETAPFAPESNRDRLLYGRFIHVTSDGGNDGSAGVSATYAHQLYDSLANVEVTSFVVNETDREVVSVKGKQPIVVDKKMVDDNYWKIFNHSFLYGKPFDRAQFDAGMKIAVISESVARDIFDATDVVDRDILLNYVPYKVVGVIKDVSSLATEAYGQVFIPWTAVNNAMEVWEPPYFGNAMVYLLARSTDDIESIRNEVKRRYDVLNSQDRGDGSQFIYHGQPFTQEMHANEHGSNNDPDVDTPRKTRYFIFAILLIIPAINLSSMTQSRLHRRVGEFGVRRAFGCTRSRIMLDLLYENLILTLAGGILGVLLSLGFTWLFSDVMFNSMFDDRSPQSMYITPEMVFNVPIFLWTLLFCLILNLLSAGIPAWRAGRINPVEAINMGNK